MKKAERYLQLATARIGLRPKQAGLRFDRLSLLPRFSGSQSNSIYGRRGARGHRESERLQAGDLLG